LNALNVPGIRQSPRRWRPTQSATWQGHQSLHVSVTEPRQAMP
jgi:hypothetical protein